MQAVADGKQGNQKHLASIDPLSGIASTIGAGFAVGGYSSGVSAFDAIGQRIFFAANAPGESVRRIYTVDITTGVMVGNPVITSADGFQTTPILLAYRATSGATAGSVPNGAGIPGVPLLANKNVVNLNDVDLGWSASCNVGATDYTVYMGDIGSFYNHDQVVCTTASSTNYTVINPGADKYFLVVPIAGTEEGSYGTDSTGSQRPQSTVPCNAVQNTSCF